MNSCNHSGISENDESPRTCSWFTSLLGFEIFVGLDDGLPRFCSSALSHSISAGIGVEPVLSCGNDVGDVEPDELDEEEVVDGAENTIGT